MTETELGGHTYRIGKLDAFKQFHVSRKIAPMLPRLVPALMQISKDGAAGDGFSKLADSLAPFADALASMEDETAEYVIGTCLSAVHRKQGSSWASVWSSQAKATMFDDMDLSTLVPLVVHVIRENLGSFIQGLLTGQMTPGQAEAA